MLSGVRGPSLKLSALCSRIGSVERSPPVIFEPVSSGCPAVATPSHQDQFSEFSQYQLTSLTICCWICIMSSDFPFTAAPSHIIEGKFVDQRKLMSLLRNVYGTSEEGKDNFRVEVVLSPPPFPTPQNSAQRTDSLSTAKTQSI